MARLRRKRIGKHAYYYLEHSTRAHGRVQKREIYLGRKLPQNIGKIKGQLVAEIFREKWHPLLKRIRDNYVKENRSAPPSSKEKEIENFAIRFTYDSQKIEGSTLTLRETANLFERGIAPRDRPLGDVREAEAHKKLFYDMLGYKKSLSLNVTLEWQRKLFYESKPDIAGKIRKSRIGISGSKFVPPLPVEVYPLLRDFFRWYNRSKDRLHPVELAALVHLKFVTIHPFADGNGRVSRLMMNFVLNRKGYPMLNIPYEGRNSYYRALERAQVSKRNDAFVLWLVKKYVKSYEDYL
ncbi:MAG: Fic family protein [Nitrososphaera sp.]